MGTQAPEHLSNSDSKIMTGNHGCSILPGTLHFALCADVCLYRIQNWSQTATKGREFNKHIKSDLDKEAHYCYHVAHDECDDIGELLFT